jgi:hypothetical protein
MKTRLLVSLLVLGALAVTARAQDPGKKETKGIIIQLGDKPGKKETKGIIIQFGDKPGLILIRDRSPDQEVMELLQKALTILAKKGQPPAAGNKADEIKMLRDQINTLRREMELLEAKLRAAQARLGQLQGKGAGLQFKLQLQGPDPKKASPQDLGIIFQDDGKVSGLKVIGLPAKKQAPVQREELQQRLNRLLREIEELRRDIQLLGPTKK